MAELMPPKWKQLNKHQRSEAVKGILTAFQDAGELDLRVTARGIHKHLKLRSDAKVIGRLAWACWVYGIVLDERAPWYREPLLDSENETLLERLCLGHRSVFEFILESAERPSREEKKAAEDMEQGLNAWLEANYYVQVKGHAFAFLSPSAIRVLNAFDPASPGQRTRRSPIVYTGAFETNRRRH